VACFRPLRAAQDENGNVRLGRDDGSGRDLELPCGRCVGCRMDRSRSWSIRIGHEAQLYDSNLFVTFDYAPEHLKSWSLDYPDFQGFMKRLRRKVSGVSPGPEGSHPLRFFVAGEYGETYKRPHWHAILFNCRLADAVPYYNGTSRSELLERLWGRGSAVIGAVTPQSAAYVAGYTQSKRYGREAEEYYEDLVNPITGEVSSRRPEFVVMSRKPGIGAWWYALYGRDVFPHDFSVQAGRKYKVPRYYFERLKRDNPAAAEEVAYGRFLRARECSEESTPERRAVREEHAQARLKMFSERNH